MSAESELYDLLSGAAGVTAIVGAQVYPDLVPQGKTPPYIGYSRVNTQPVNAIDGSHLADLIGLTVTCWADTRVGAEALADAVVAAIAASAGSFEFTARGVEVDEETGREGATVDCQILI